MNPAHLFLGTNDDNKADMIRKDRQAKGERSPFAKLNAEAVVALRQAHAARVSIAEIAMRFGIGKSQIDKIVRRKAWKHVP